MTQDTPRVTQADREAAAQWARMQSRHAQAANMLRGSCDTAPLVQLMARRRTAAEDASRAEIEALREALKVAKEGLAYAELWFTIAEIDRILARQGEPSDA